MRKILYIFLMLAFSVSATAQRWQSSQPFHSEKLGQDLPYAVVLPAEYEANPEARYPVVYLTHGIGCTPDDWNDKYIQFENTLTQLEAEGLGDMIYIFPTGFNQFAFVTTVMVLVDVPLLQVAAEAPIEAEQSIVIAITAVLNRQPFIIFL